MKSISRQKISAVTAYKNYVHHMHAIEEMHQRSEYPCTDSELIKNPSLLHRISLLLGSFSVLSHSLYFLMNYEFKLISLAIGIILITIGLYGYFPISSQIGSKFMKTKIAPLFSDKRTFRA